MDSDDARRAGFTGGIGGTAVWGRDIRIIDQPSSSLIELLEELTRESS
jgi:hypothetical protein